MRAHALDASISMPSKLQLTLGIVEQAVLDFSLVTTLLV
jgi:hypothetical protein